MPYDLIRAASVADDVPSLAIGLACFALLALLVEGAKRL